MTTPLDPTRIPDVNFEGSKSGIKMGISTWTSAMYQAWVMIGATQTVAMMYFFQQYYYKFWKGASTDYVSYGWKNYGAWSSGTETVALILSMFLYSIGSFLWLASAFDDLYMIIAFVNFVTGQHWIELIRMLLLVVGRVGSFAADSRTDYVSYNALSMSYNISKPHMLEYWDILGEFLFMQVNFGFYNDLKEIKYLSTEQLQFYGASTKEGVLDKRNDAAKAEAADEGGL